MITNQLANIDHIIFDENLAFTFLRGLPPFFHTLVVSLNLFILMNNLQSSYVKYVVGIIMVFKQEALTIKVASKKFKKGVNQRKLKNKKPMKMGTFYNYGIKGHFARKCHENKQDWKNKFKNTMKKRGVQQFALQFNF